MDSLRIDTGLKRVLINGDPERVISFNPQDVIFVERFYALMQAFAEREKEFSDRAKALDAEEAVDEYGLPVNTSERLAFMREIADWMRGQIDAVFGADTSQKAFGDACTLNMFEQFFDGILPFIEAVRSEKVKKYSKVQGKAIMD